MIELSIVFEMKGSQVSMDRLAELKHGKDADAYRLLLALEAESRESNALYGHLEFFISLTQDSRSYVRVRGFRLACAQARWDSDHRIEAHLDALLRLLDDEKPTVVRQCLEALQGAIAWKPHLAGPIEEKLNSMDLSRYRDSMARLIERDVEALRSLWE